MGERLFQVGIKGLIRNELGKILLVSSQSSNGDIRWDMPGGRMNEGETFEQTLNRELLEEIDSTYASTPIYFATSLSNAQITVRSNTYGLILITYLVTLPTNAVITLNDYETGYDWFDIEPVATLLQTKYPSDFIAQIKQL